MTRLFFIIVVLLLVRCSNRPALPAGIIAQPTMETVLWQLMQADEFFANYVIKDSTKNTTAERTKLYQQVFSIHKISREEFKKSYDFYINRPEISRPMFDSLAARAGRKRNEVYNKQAQKSDTATKKDTALPVTKPPKFLKLRKDTLK
jgi:hypothetical protein